MNIVEENEMPRLVPSGQGISILNTVEYKKKFLYSKYNPSKAAIELVKRTEIMPGTLVVICSPVLWYGFRELLEKIPQDCSIICVEQDPALHSLAEKIFSENFPDQEKCLFKFSDATGINTFIEKACSQGKIRRPLRLDFSAGTNLAPEKYQTLLNATQSIINGFWANRVTLSKMGRLYSKNIFGNLRKLEQGALLSDLSGQVSLPIVVFGAGESIDSFLDSGFDRNGKFILAADAALPSLTARGIIPDGVVAVEAQLAIQKAYIGQKNTDMILFADLCSRKEIPDFFTQKTVWFASRFTECEFLEILSERKIVPEFMEPMGSVGLYAVKIALELRASKNIPVYFTGLDFSWSVGKTHAKETPAHKTMLFSSCRARSIENIDAAFSPASEFVMGKDGRPTCTSKVMKSYANKFRALFSGTDNLFDLSERGINLQIPHSDSVIAKEDSKFTPLPIKKNPERGNAIKMYLTEEKTRLLELKNILSNGELSPFRIPELSIKDQISSLLSGREYLYLHFPDGHRLSLETSFLKRVRAEIDFFLKQIEINSKK